MKLALQLAGKTGYQIAKSDLGLLQCAKNEFDQSTRIPQLLRSSLDKGRVVEIAGIRT